MNENKKIALVTGANRGIGFGVCRRLAEKNYTVFLTGRDAGKVKSAAEKLQAEDLDVLPQQLDVTDAESVEQACATVERRVGRLDALVNNAAIDYDTDQNVLTADLGRVRQALETNTLGPWRVTLAFLPVLRKSGHGRIVNVSSGAGALKRMNGRTPAYSLSKLALNGITQMMATALEDDGILVNAVGPGWVRTEMGGANANRSIAEGAASVVWAVTLPDDGPTGGFFRDGEPVKW